jgi:hypothetical protein
MARAGPRSGNITAQRAALLAKGPNYEAFPGGRALTPEESRRLAQNTASPGGYAAPAMKRGGKVSSKPKASSASSRGDGIAQRGKTRGKYL